MTKDGHERVATLSPSASRYSSANAGSIRFFSTLATLAVGGCFDAAKTSVATGLIGRREVDDRRRTSLLACVGRGAVGNESSVSGTGAVLSKPDEAKLAQSGSVAVLDVRSCRAAADDVSLMAASPTRDGGPR